MNACGARAITETGQIITIAEAARNGIEGVLLLKITVDREGEILTISVTAEERTQQKKLMFLARAKVGPFRVDTEPHLGADGRLGVRSLLVDEGAERAVTSASHVFRAVG